MDHPEPRGCERDDSIPGPVCGRASDRVEDGAAQPIEKESVRRVQQHVDEVVAERPQTVEIEIQSESSEADSTGHALRKKDAVQLPERSDLKKRPVRDIRTIEKKRPVQRGRIEREGTRRQTQCDGEVRCASHWNA